MDPLSIPISIVTILSAVQTGVRAAIRIHEAPRELSVLALELSDLTNVVRGISALPRAHIRFSGLSLSLLSTKACILELDELIHYRLLSADHKRVDRWAWTWNRQQIKSLREQLRIKKDSLTASLVLLNSSSSLLVEQNINVILAKQKNVHQGQRDIHQLIGSLASQRTQTDQILHALLEQNTLLAQRQDQLGALIQGLSLGSFRLHPSIYRRSNLPRHQAPMEGREPPIRRSDEQRVFLSNHLGGEHPVLAQPVITSPAQLIRVRPRHQMFEFWKWPESEYNEKLGHFIPNLSMYFRDGPPREKFFVTYIGENRQTWRITMTCDYTDCSPDGLFTQIFSLEYQRDKSALIWDYIKDSLSNIEFFSTVTNLRLEEAHEEVRVHVTEDVNEILVYPDIRDVLSLDCPFYTNSAVEFLSHLAGFTYSVKVGSTKYCRKDLEGFDSVTDFLRQVRYTYELQAFPGTVRLSGIMLDDDKHTVRGFLTELLEQGTLMDILYDFKGRISWTRRMKWAYQIIKALRDIHLHNIICGSLTLSAIGINADDEAKILRVGRGGCPVGWEPPELLKLMASGRSISNHVGARTDIFQLGMVLWAIAAEDDEPERNLSCSGPLEQSFKPYIPTQYRQAVMACLSESPQDRPSAEQTLRSLRNM